MSLKISIITKHMTVTQKFGSWYLIIINFRSKNLKYYIHLHLAKHIFHLVIFLDRLSLICFYLLIQRNAKVLFQPPASDIVLFWFGVHLMLFTSAYISYIWTWKLVLCQKLPIHFIPIYGCFLYRQYLHDPLCYHRKVRSIKRNYFIRR